MPPPPHRPPSTAMTLGSPQSEAELLLEDRKGGHLHISRLLSGISTQRAADGIFSHCFLMYLTSVACFFVVVRDCRKVHISPRGAGSLRPLSNAQLRQSEVQNLRYQTESSASPVAQARSSELKINQRTRAAGYSSHHSSLTDLGHRRSVSAGSASTGIGSILEASDQHPERGERESGATPTVSAAERPSTPAKLPRYPSLSYAPLTPAD